ncbi:MAG: TonB-dependent receptor [Muribaculaceae bacterium]|nr:TonB-dependent receptor [Muribaculaceae bacterium]
MNHLRIIISALCAVSAIPCTLAHASSDTIAERKLDEVVVRATRTKSETIPVQTLTGDDLKRLNSNSVADALRYFAGVQVKDYGGVGGIKTVNIRSMGTNHTGVVYDGVQLGNAQNGQIDLGQFSLDNIEAISLHNGQKSALLQPARDFGNAGTVYLRTKTPVFDDGATYHARATLRFGSFDLINPSALVELKLSEKVNASLSAEWLNSSGKYKFRYRRVNPAGELAYDTTAVRQNGDINATRIEMNLNGNLTNGVWHFKAYNYNSERGVPGAIVNNVWRRGERIWDTNSFVQGSTTLSHGRWTTMENIKYAFYRTHYVNNDEKQIKVDNLYRQREFYFSTANRFEIMNNWSASASYDFLWNTLNADMHGFARPSRVSNLLSVATAINLPRLKVTASGLMTFVHDHLRGQESPADKHVFTPAVYTSFYPLRDREFSVRAFYKKSFRMPTFNDLYYADMGNSKLNPERVEQFNAGLLFDTHHDGFLSAMRFSCDAYYNNVRDKIVAYPKGQQFRWTMLNLGVVDIRGIDLTALLTVNPRADLYLTFRGQYTYQKAIDITNPADNYYRHQIPYIPHHSGSAVVNATWRRLGLNYSFIYVGERYNQQENIRYNYTQPWYTSDLSVSYDLRMAAVNTRILAEVNNLFSQDYDVIINYPMPKRNFRISLTVEL